MEIAEVFDRILRVHWKLIAGLLVAGLLIGFAISGNDDPTYTATTRALIDRPEPNDEGEALAIADAVRAIVTSPTVVERVLDDANIRRSAIRMVQEQRITVATVGSSGIVEITVTDRDPAAAAELSNLLAEDLIDTRLKSTRGNLDEALAGVDERIAQLETSLDRLNEDLSGASTELRAQVAEQKAPLTEQLVRLEEKRAELLSEQAGLPRPQIIDPARKPLEADPSRLPADLALGGLLGLVLGVSGAVILESIRPTVVGGPAVSRELDAPVLGFLSTPPDRSRAREIAPVAAWLTAAAESAGVRTVALMGTRKGDGLENLAAELSARVSGASPLDIRTLDLPEQGNGGRYKPIAASAGLVVVTPEIARRGDLAAVRDLSGMTGRRLLGAIAYRGSGSGMTVKGIRKLLGVTGGLKDVVTNGEARRRTPDRRRKVPHE